MINMIFLSSKRYFKTDQDLPIDSHSDKQTSDLHSRYLTQRANSLLLPNGNLTLSLNKLDKVRSGGASLHLTHQVFCSRPDFCATRLAYTKLMLYRLTKKESKDNKSNHQHKYTTYRKFF